jgi:hypothetical protein
MNHKAHKCIVCVTALPALVALYASSAYAAAPGWNGWVRCEINTQNSGTTKYVHKETQTWAVTGAQPNAVTAGTWSTAGRGQLDKEVPPTQWDHSEWAINANAASGVRFEVPVYGNTLSVRAAGGMQANGVSAFWQQWISGVARKPTQWMATAYEAPVFPVVQGPANATTLSGSTPPQTLATPWGPNASGTATSMCIWSFAKDVDPLAPPAVPAAPNPVPAPEGSTKPPATPADVGRKAQPGAKLLPPHNSDTLQRDPNRPPFPQPR